ncbi:MAG: pantoate--beta-alanine ligase [Flavobacteriaceae bacterium]|nr:pantoate--beta-alanine ligase [Flavobacteriaceae bacterium]
MFVFNNIKNLQQHLSSINDDENIGFVPTMGALHEGHLSLIKRAQKKSDIIVVSIFVNPTQFDKPEDLVKYPRTLENDLKLLETVNCDVIFTPTVDEIYGDTIQSTSFTFDGLEHQMEGKFRDGHFDGVGTIVKRLFEIVKPTNAYFGEKDFQQLQIIKKMVEKHKILINVTGCEIFRENDGLAMSSRNTRLTKEHRLAAPFIYKTIKKAKKKFKKKSPKKVINWVKKKFKKHSLLELEYFEIADEKTLQTIEKKDSDKKYRAFIAVFAGEIRLIDNIKL